MVGVWSAWADASGQAILAERQAAWNKACKRFGRRDEYEYSAEAMAAMKPGRQRILAYLRCYRKLVRLMGRRSQDGGQGIRLSPEQERLADMMRDSMILRFYDGNTTELLADLEFLRGITPDAYNLYNYVAIILARRSGKTLTETTVGPSTILSQPDGNVLCYNMVQGQAQQWQAECDTRAEMLRNDDEFGHAIAKKRDGQFTDYKRFHIKGRNTRVRVFGNARDKRNAQNLRSSGNNALWVCLDEGLFYHEEAYKVRSPLLFHCSYNLPRKMDHIKPSWWELMA